MNTCGFSFSKNLDERESAYCWTHSPLFNFYLFKESIKGILSVGNAMHHYIGPVVLRVLHEIPIRQFVYFA